MREPSGYLQEEASGRRSGAPVLSRRVFGYGIEHVMLNHVKQLARKAGKSTSISSNEPFREVYPQNGFAREGTPGFGTAALHWRTRRGSRSVPSLRSIRLNRHLRSLSVVSSALRPGRYTPTGEKKANTVSTAKRRQRSEAGGEPGLGR
jgi:hypothetical protein